MCTSSSLAVWEAIPLLSFVQFPWRFVGRALLPITILAGSAFTVDSSSQRIRKTSTAFRKSLFNTIICSVIIILILSALPDTYPPKGLCSLEPYPDIADVTAYEQQGWLGMDPEQSYFPVWVGMHPSDSSLANAFALGQLPERLDLDSLPNGVEVLSADYNILSASIRIKSPQAFQVRWKGLYFPGWKVRIGGQELPITPEKSTGLIIFNVPAGEHLIKLRFGSTPARTVGIILLFVGSIVLIILLVRKPFLRQNNTAKMYRRGPKSLGTVMFVLAVFLLFVKFALVDNFETPIRRSRVQDNQLPEVKNTLEQDFADAITLSGYTIPPVEVTGDGEIQIDLLWQARGTPQQEFNTMVLAVGSDGQAWSPAGTLRPSGYEVPPPKNMWREGNYVFDPHILSLLPGTPPGIYQLEVVIFDRYTLEPISVVNSDGSLGEPSYRLGSIKVTRPEKPYSLKSFDVGEESEANLCGPFALWSMTLDRAGAAPGDIIAVRWVWERMQTGGETPGDAELVLTNPDGEVVHTWELPLSTTWWLTDDWVVGERWVGRHIVRLPNKITGGMHTVSVNLPTCEKSLASVELSISDIVREWEIPDHFTRIQARFGEQISLVGFNLEGLSYSSGDTVELGLSWQAEQEMVTSYRVFLHLVDSEGRVVDQDDGEPVNWTRPTTGWLPKEIVNEVRELVVPETIESMTYDIHVGLYTQAGERLTLPNGEDTYVIARIQVGDE
jgi:hypothetical protein